MKMRLLVIAAAVTCLLGIMTAVALAKPDEPEVNSRTVTVRNGDTLWEISARFGFSWRWTELARENGIQESRIFPGQVLRLPADWPDYFESASLDCQLYEDKASRSYWGKYYHQVRSETWYSISQTTYGKCERTDILPEDRPWVLYPAGLKYNGSSIEYIGWKGYGEIHDGILPISRTTVTEGKINAYFDDGGTTLYGTKLKISRTEHSLIVMTNWVQVNELVPVKTVEPFTLPDLQGRKNPGKVNWVVGETLTVTQHRYGWEKDSRSGSQEILILMTLQWVETELTRANGEKVLFLQTYRRPIFYTKIGIHWTGAVLTSGSFDAPIGSRWNLESFNDWLSLKNW